MAKTRGEHTRRVHCQFQRGPRGDAHSEWRRSSGWHEAFLGRTRARKAARRGWPLERGKTSDSLPSITPEGFINGVARYPRHLIGALHVRTSHVLKSVQGRVMTGSNSVSRVSACSWTCVPIRLDDGFYGSGS